MKVLIKYLWHHFFKYFAFGLDFLYLKIKPTPIIKSKIETIDEIINHKMSIGRLGDGEFNLIFGKGIEFQQYDHMLSNRLRVILNNNNPNFLVGIPDVFYNYDRLEAFDSNWWKLYMCKNRYNLYRYINFNSIYYDTNISRPYMIYKDKEKSQIIFEKLKKIWENRNIIIVEGHESRLGVGNDLFYNAKSIRRILCPVRNAFSVYNKIYNTVLKIYTEEDLVLIALGPTATVLAYDLSLKNVQAIDIGHVDIEYSWMLMKTKTKVPVKGKYTNEAYEKVDECLDKNYLSQIIYKIDENTCSPQ